LKEKGIKGIGLLHVYKGKKKDLELCLRTKGKEELIKKKT